MITPLKKHPGQRGGVIALSLLAITTIAVWAMHPKHASHPAEPSRPKPAPAIVAPAPPVERTVAPPIDDATTATVTGTSSYDENHTHRVFIPVSGWMQKTRASSLGRTVRAGERLAIVYSPQVYVASEAVVAQVREFHGQTELDAARMQLLRWGMPRPTLAHIEATLTPQAALPIIARVTGTVITETGAQKQLVEQGFEPMTITDPTSVWAFVDVPDARAARVTVGSTAKLTVEGIARPFVAKVGYVYRRSEDGMRKVQLELTSRAPLIKPNTPVKAELQLARAAR